MGSRWSSPVHENKEDNHENQGSGTYPQTSLGTRGQARGWLCLVVHWAQHHLHMPHLHLEHGEWGRGCQSWVRTNSPPATHGDPPTLPRLFHGAPGPSLTHP